MYMAGTLWKWTNYFSGWQERWFVLDNGILSYYKSQDDVNTGCKGSVKMSVCDIAVHATDTTRLDLIIPGEQHFYVKAPNAHERQHWLVALGSAKASMGKLGEESESVTHDLMKTKRSELRLYCDLLMQQIHSVKMAVQGAEKTDAVTQKLDQASSLISPTCDMFIQTLEECMELVHAANLPFEGQQSPITDAALPPSPLKIPNKKGKSAQRQGSSDRVPSQNHSRSPSASSMEISFSRQNSRPRTTSESSLSDMSPNDHGIRSPSGLTNSSKNGVNSHSKQTNIHPIDSVQSNYTISDSKSASHRLQNINETGSTNVGVNDVNSNNNSETSRNFSVIQSSLVEDQSRLKIDEADDVEVFLDPIEPRVPTFFSVMPVSLMDLKLTADGGIPVEPFLNACKNLLPIFDKLNSTAFAPVKMDFQGNIRKVRTKYLIHPEKFSTLQNIILHEISKKQQYQPSSATMALLWMKRSLEFISGFVLEIKKGEQNLSTAATNAYASSLKPFHGWVVRGVFAVAVKALPYRDTFLTLMNPEEGQVDEQAYHLSLMVDIETFCDATKVVVDILNDYFMSNNLNVNEQI